MLIPLPGMQLLLPSVCVAEILPWRRITAHDAGVDWCLGMMGWRGESIPVIRFERLNQPRAESATTGRCLVVMNRTGTGGGPAFYALAAEGLPRMVQLTDDDLGVLEARLGRAEASSVRVGTEVASIPNLRFLEQQVGGLKYEPVERQRSGGNPDRSAEDSEDDA